MTTFALPGMEGGGVGAEVSVPAGKIIQRISRPGLSDFVKPSRMADADAELVLQSQKGDSAAFEVLVRNHQRMVHSLTFRMTGSLTDADDLAQESFLRAYEQIGSFRGTAKFSTWLYRIAVNACLNWQQNEARRCQAHARCADELFSQAAPGENSPAENPASLQVQAALLKLPAKQRAAIVLTVYDGLNHAATAQILGCSEATVSWRVFAARRKLKRWLSRNGGAE